MTGHAVAGPLLGLLFTACAVDIGEESLGLTGDGGPDGPVTLTFARVSGSLPDHLALTTGGSFTRSGNHKKGSFASSIRVTDPTGRSATTNLTIVVQ